MRPATLLTISLIGVLSSGVIFLATSSDAVGFAAAIFGAMTVLSFCWLVAGWFPKYPSLAEVNELFLESERRRRSDELAQRGRQELDNGHVMAAADLYREAMQAMTEGRLDLAEATLDYGDQLDVSRLLEAGAEMNQQAAMGLSAAAEIDRIFRELRASDDGPSYDTSDIGDIGTDELKSRYTVVWQNVHHSTSPTPEGTLERWTNALRMMENELRMRGLHIMWELNSTSPFFIEGPRNQSPNVATVLAGQAQVRSIEPEANGDFCVSPVTRDALFAAASRFAAVHNCFPNMLFLDISNPNHHLFVRSAGLDYATAQRLLRGQLAQPVAMYGMTLIQRAHGPMEVSHSHPGYTAPEPAAPPTERLRHLDI